MTTETFYLRLYEGPNSICRYCHQDQAAHGESLICPIRGCTLYGPPTVAETTVGILAKVKAIFQARTLESLLTAKPTPSPKLPTKKD